MIPSLLPSPVGLAVIQALNPAAWFRYGIGITDAGGGKCSAWADQSGVGNIVNLAQGNAGKQPTINADKSISTDGAATYLSKGGFTAIPQPFTIVAAIRVDTYSASGRLIATNNGIFCNAGATALQLQQGTSLGLASSPSAGTWSVISAVANGASSLIQNGLNAPSSGNAGTNSMTVITLGATSTELSFLAATYKEIIIFPSALATADLTRVIRYVAAVGGVAV